MIVKFNSSGTHIHKKKLKIRLDIYPEPGEDSYDKYHIEYFDIDGNSMGYFTNPILCHFITISDTTTKEDVESFINTKLSSDVLKTISSISAGDIGHKFNELMSDKALLATKEIETINKNNINKNFKDIEIRTKLSGVVYDIEEHSITMGVEPQDFSGYLNNNQYTLLNLTNPANASGTITTVKTWMYLAVTESSWKVGTFYASNGNYVCRDFEEFGDVAQGEEVEFTGLDLSVEEGDLIGSYGEEGRIERETENYDDLLYVSGDHVIVDDEASYSTAFDDCVALQGIGTEDGGAATPTELFIIPFSK